MEIGDQHFYNLILITRSNNYLCASMERILSVTVKIVYYILQSLYRRQVCLCFIRLPLIYM